MAETMDCNFKVTDLKSILKRKGLRGSGAKSKLIDRLIAFDRNAMLELTQGTDAYRCTLTGRQLAEAYVEHEETKRAGIENDVLSLLIAGEYAKAVHEVAQFEAGQVFARGLGIDWMNYDGTSDVESIRAIFTTTPAILRGIEKDRLRQIRPAAGMMHLWGTGTAKKWLPDGFDTGIHLDGNTACRMLVFHAANVRNLKQFEECGIKSVKIIGSGDDGCCDECKKISGRKYRLHEIPELPYPSCTSEDGCRCIMLVDVGSLSG